MTLNTSVTLLEKGLRKYFEIIFLRVLVFVIALKPKLEDAQNWIKDRDTCLTCNFSIHCQNRDAYNVLQICTLPAPVALFRALYILCQSSRSLPLENVHSFKKRTLVFMHFLCLSCIYSWMKLKCSSQRVHNFCQTFSQKQACSCSLNPLEMCLSMRWKHDLLTITTRQENIADKAPFFEELTLFFKNCDCSLPGIGQNRNKTTLNTCYLWMRWGKGFIWSGNLHNFVGSM